MLPASFRAGSSNAKEAAPRRELRMLGVLRCRPPEEIASAGSAQKPPCGVYRDCWERFANRPRREMPAGAPRRALPVDFFGDLWYDIS